MRKGLLFVLLVFVWSTLRAQNADVEAWRRALEPVAETGNNVRCDSIVAKTPEGKSYDKIVNVFDEKDNMVSRIRSMWDDFSESWIADSRYDYEYDENKNVTLQVSMLWDGSQKEWINQEKTERTFNNLGKMLSMDSFVWEGGNWLRTFQGRATFDERGNMLTEFSLIYDRNTSAWAAISKSEYTYNALDLPIEILNYQGITGLSEFMPSFRTEYAYDENGNLILRAMSDWSEEAQQYLPTTKDVYVFDNAGNELCYTYYYKDFETGELTERAKREKSYDERNNMLSDFFYTKDAAGAWSLSSKDEYTYNAMDSVTMKVSSSKDFITGEMIFSMKQESEFDGSGNRILNLTFFWDSAVNDWLNGSKNERVYSDGNRLLSEKSYMWMNITALIGDWVENFRAEYEYDENGYQTSSASYQYDMMQNVWVGQFKSDAVYDPDGNVLEEINYQWLESISDWKCTGSIIYYYSTATGTIPVEAVPVTVIIREGRIEVLSPEKVRISVYDMEGKIVSRDKGSIAVPGAGCYIVVINDSRSYKVVVK